MLSNLSQLSPKHDSLMNILKGQGVECGTFPAVRLGLSHVLHLLPNSFWRCFCLVSHSLHTRDITHTVTAYCLCLQVILATPEG